MQFISVSTPKKMFHKFMRLYLQANYFKKDKKKQKLYLVKNGKIYYYE